MARTIAEIAVAVGLEDPEEWRRGREKRADLPPGRCLGRTTAMLLDALQAMEEGEHVCIASAKSRLLHGGPCNYKRTDFQEAWKRGWFAVDNKLYKPVTPIFETQYEAGPSPSPPPTTTEHALGLLDKSPDKAPPGELPTEDVPGRS